MIGNVVDGSQVLGRQTRESLRECTLESCLVLLQNLAYPLSLGALRDVVERESSRRTSSGI
jgi:hypothetical protein